MEMNGWILLPFLMMMEFEFQSTICYPISTELRVKHMEFELHARCTSTRCIKWNGRIFFGNTIELYWQISNVYREVLLVSHSLFANYCLCM